MQRASASLMTNSVSVAHRESPGSPAGNCLRHQLHKELNYKKHATQVSHQSDSYGMDAS
ncbi:hypothetical protein I79_016322 [Cricetulus griseus]|uniref:Uncharacterized protein n=1 Tax=Cricetulus griseus TaxID=10029 RepID=G3HZ27_CRIGR|nr:hypothetical protein I79_016322 [Cricetulus griseus]